MYCSVAMATPRPTTIWILVFHRNDKIKTCVPFVFDAGLQIGLAELASHFPLLQLSFLHLSFPIAAPPSHSPHFSATVVCYKQRSVRQFRHAYRTPIGFEFILVGNKPGEDILHRSGRLAVFEGDKSNVVTHHFGAVPRTMHADESAALVALRKSFAAIESEPQSSHMGANSVVGFDRFGYEIGPLAFFPRVFMLAKVRKRPAVETAFLDAGQIVGDQIVAQEIALIDDCP